MIGKSTSLVVLVLLCVGSAIAATMSPKLASMQPRPQSVPLVTVQLVTNTAMWFNKQPIPPLPPVVTNTLRYWQIGTTSSNAIAMPLTNQATVIAPSNSIAMNVTASTAGGITSGPSNTRTNAALPPVPPATNVWQVQPMFSTNLLQWQNSGTPWFFTNIGIAGNGFFRLKLTPQ